MEYADSPSLDSGSDADRLRCRQLRWVLHAILTVLLIATAWAFSFPDVFFPLWLPLITCWAVLSLGWLVYTVVHSIPARSLGWLKPRHAAVPIAAMIALVLSFTDTSFNARFRLTQSSMDADALQIIREPKLAKQTSRIGSWRAEQVETFDGGMRFLIPDVGFLDPVGFAYSASGSPPNLGGEDIYRRQSNHWWIWQESW
jgi:hypothetical protein